MIAALAIKDDCSAPHSKALRPRRTAPPGRCARGGGGGRQWPPCGRFRAAGFARGGA